jgi:hypothetical protein
MDKFLSEHGTTLMDLPPGAIAGAADNDLKIRAGKQDETIEASRHYAFHHKHVRKADCAADVIRAALADLDLGPKSIGLSSAKPTTRLIYSQREKLIAALAISKQRGE